MQHARMNEACNLVEQYVTNFENGWKKIQAVETAIHKMIR